MLDNLNGLILSTTAIAAALWAFSPPALAAEVGGATLEEIIITATRRAENLQDVPQAITAISERDLQDIGVQDFSQLAQMIPGVELRNQQAGKGSLAIRGVSELNGDNLQGGAGSSVGFYLDEMPLTMAGYLPDIKSFDVSRIEVLKGPQGTLYGEGSLSGTVRLIANQPDAADYAAKIDMTASDTAHGKGNYALNGMLNIPLVQDKLAVRVTGFAQKTGGFIETTTPSGALTEKNDNYNETTGGRISLRVAPSEKVTVTATALISRADRGAANIAKLDRTVAQSIQTRGDDDIDAYNLTAKFDLGFAELLSSTSYFKRESAGEIDQGGLVPQVNFVFGMFGIPIVVDGVYSDQWLETKAFAQEVRLVSSGDGPFQWTLGGFYKNHKSNLGFTGDSNPAVPAAVWISISQYLTGGALSIPDALFIDTHTKTDQIAAFGELSYDVTEQLEILVGARVFKEKRDSTTTFSGVFPVLMGGPLPGSFSSSDTDEIFNPKATITYRWSDDILTYITASRGFRSGGQNDLSIFVPGSDIAYAPEKLTNYEAGMKSTLLDGRARVNVALFHMDWKNLQAVVAEGPGGVGEVIGNIGKAHSRGAEAELTAQLLESLTLNLAATVLSAKTDEDTLVPDPSGGAPILVPKGTRIPNAAKGSISASLNYRFAITDDLSGFARAAYSHTAGATNNIARSTKTPGFDIVDLKVGIEQEAWEFSVFANNVFDEKVLLSRTISDNLGDGAARYFWGSPRTIGSNIRVKF